MLIVTRCQCQSWHTSCCVPGAYWCAKSRTDSACSDSGVSSATELPDVVIGSAIPQLLLCSDDIVLMYASPRQAAVFRTHQEENCFKHLTTEHRSRSPSFCTRERRTCRNLVLYTASSDSFRGSTAGAGTEVWPRLTNATGDLRPFEIFLREMHSIATAPFR